jgi:hypothetical protein
MRRGEHLKNGANTLKLLHIQYAAGTARASQKGGVWGGPDGGDTMVLGECYRARCGTGFDAYMALQRALLARWLARGGTEESWCQRMAPLFRARYGGLMQETVLP